MITSIYVTRLRYGELNRQVAVHRDAFEPDGEGVSGWDSFGRGSRRETSCL
jgi:hypothetical protein